MISHEGLAIHVDVKTEIKDQDDLQVIHISSTGRLYKKNDSLFVQFKEESKEQGVINQVIKVDTNNAVTVLRQGAVSMKQTFVVNEMTEGVYRSQFGTMLMETMTKECRVELCEKDYYGTITLNYQLHMQKQFAGNYTVTINFRRKDG